MITNGWKERLKVNDSPYGKGCGMRTWDRIENERMAIEPTWVVEQVERYGKPKKNELPVYQELWFQILVLVCLVLVLIAKVGEF